MIKITMNEKDEWTASIELEMPYVPQKGSTIFLNDLNQEFEIMSVQANFEKGKYVGAMVWVKKIHYKE